MHTPDSKFLSPQGKYRPLYYVRIIVLASYHHGVLFVISVAQNIQSLHSLLNYGNNVTTEYTKTMALEYHMSRIHRHHITNKIVHNLKIFAFNKCYYLLANICLLVLS